MRETVILICALAAACGGSDGGSPAGPSPTPQSITVTSASDLLHIGASEAFSATATMSDGSTRSVSGGTWISENPSFATVDGNGRVTGVGSGPVAIHVDYLGQRGSRSIRVLPNYQGTWSGSYFVTGCSHSGDFRRFDFCSNFPANRVLPTNLNVTQDRDRVQGRFFLGTLGGDGSGPVQSDGRLLLTGAIQDGGTTIDTNWVMDSRSAGRITGSLAFLWRSTGLSGDVRVEAEIRDLNRTSSSTAPESLVARPHGRTLEVLLRALRGGS